jgi:hypothetical protein
MRSFPKDFGSKTTQTLSTDPVSIDFLFLLSDKPSAFVVLLAVDHAMNLRDHPPNLICSFDKIGFDYVHRHCNRAIWLNPCTTAHSSCGHVLHNKCLARMHQHTGHERRSRG